MGALLHGVENMRSPLGIAIIVGVIAVIYLFYRWAVAEPKDKSEQNKTSQ
jgi:hypothetical protein